SGLGTDGTCSHLFLEGVEDKNGRCKIPSADRPIGPLDEGLFALEADTAGELLEKISQLQDFIDSTNDDGVEQLARQWYLKTSLNRENRLCLAMVAANRTELLDQLQQAALSLLEDPHRSIGGNGAPCAANLRDRLFYTPEPLAPHGKIAFIFPGSGNHFAGMGRELSARWPAIFSRQDSRSQFLARQFLPEQFWQEALTEAVHDDHNALVIGQVALGTAVSDLVRSFGIEPQAISGYSLGESAGLFSLGVWKDRDGMAQRLSESTLFTSELAGVCNAARQVWGLKKTEEVDWVLGLIDVPAEKVKQALAGKTRAYLLIINSYRESVIGGDRQQVEALTHEVGGHFFPLRGVTTVHCPVVEPVAKAYRDLHLFPVTTPQGVDFYSCARGERYHVSTQSAADVILEQALTTIDYTKVIEQAYTDGVRIFLEIGPGNSCSRMISSILDGRPHMTRAVCYPGQKPISLILRLLANALSERVPVDLSSLYPEAMRQIDTRNKPKIQTVIGGRPFTPPLLPEGPTSAAAQEEHTEPSPVAARDEERCDETRDMQFENLAQSAAPGDPLLAQMTTTATLNADAHAAYLS
ncbi:MAG: type I polyketide synthase, partial [Desulfuromonadales bacterium]|nr:type I polyketide synthase [Desulfuromonadales bacterium]